MINMLYIPDNEINSYTLVSDCGLYAIRPIRMIEGFALPISILTNTAYEWAWPLLSNLKIKEMNNIEINDVPKFIIEKEN